MPQTVSGEEHSAVPACTCALSRQSTRTFLFSSASGLVFGRFGFRCACNTLLSTYYTYLPPTYYHPPPAAVRKHCIVHFFFWWLSANFYYYYLLPASVLYVFVTLPTPALTSYHLPPSLPTFLFYRSLLWCAVHGIKLLAMWLATNFLPLVWPLILWFGFVLLVDRFCYPWRLHGTTYSCEDVDVLRRMRDSSIPHTYFTIHGHDDICIVLLATRTCRARLTVLLRAHNLLPPRLCILPSLTIHTISFTFACL